MLLAGLQNHLYGVDMMDRRMRSIGTSLLSNQKLPNFVKNIGIILRELIVFNNNNNILSSSLLLTLLH